MDENQEIKIKYISTVIINENVTQNNVLQNPNIYFTLTDNE